MKSFWTTSTLSVLALVSLASGQQEGVHKHTPRAVQTTNAPVSQSEARTVFVKVESLMRKSLDLPAAKPGVGIPQSSAAVKRSQVVAEFARIYQVVRPKVKLTPRDTAFDPKVVKLTDAKQKANLLALIKMGAVARIGPLSVGPTDSLTVPEFGDAVGFFISRMAFMTHLPSSDWTGSLKKS